MTSPFWLCCPLQVHVRVLHVVSAAMQLVAGAMERRQGVSGLVLQFARSSGSGQMSGADQKCFQRSVIQVIVQESGAALQLETATSVAFTSVASDYLEPLTLRTS